MADDSAIAWTDDTVNGWWGCTPISPACRYCYAREWSGRHSERLCGAKELWGADAPRWMRVEAAQRDLRRIARRSGREGRPRRVFMHSMSDLFEANPKLDASRRALWDELHALAGRITPLLLTKRPDVMLAWAKEHGWPRGAWAGVTVENEAQARARLPLLLDLDGPAGRFISAEPLLGPLQLPDVLLQGIGWVIVGGESGRQARPMDLAWARRLRDQCQRLDVPYFFKQVGGRTAGKGGQLLLDGQVQQQLPASMVTR